MARRVNASWVGLGLAAAMAVPAVAQPAPTTIRWEHAVAAGAGVVLLTFFDEGMRQLVQENKSATLDEMSNVAKRFKDPAVFYVAGGGAVLAGLAGRNADVTRTGAQILASYGLSSAIMIGSKWTFGRTRPWDTPYDPHEFDWFNGGAEQSFPSGSAAVVFSLATTLADAIDRTPITIGLYAAAAANSWSRVYSNRHWVTDVVAAGLIGIASAKIVNGRWSVFGLRPPTVGRTPDGRTTLGYTLGR